MKLRIKLTIIFLIVALVSALPIFLISNILLRENIKLFINPDIERLIDQSLIKTKGQEESVKKLSLEYKKLKFFQETIEKSIYIGSLLVLFLMVIVAIVAGRLISKAITTPILYLLEGTKKLSLGDVDCQIRERSKIYEIVKLTKAFNNMIARIKKGKEDLVEAQKKLIESEKETTWQAVAQKVAHEIKNPLTPIKLSIERIIRKQEEKDPEFEQILKEGSQIILEEVEELYRLTHGFSEFAKLPKLEFKLNNINKIIEEVIEIQEKLYPEVEFHREFSKNLSLMVLDKNSLKRAFTNLAKNSVESMYEGGIVFFKTEQDQNMIKIEVVDNGCGIKEEDLSLIFEPYYSKKWGGMGLGLSIVKSIIEEHQGKIKVESKENKGTKFIVYLPSQREESEL
ncbi:GHKL domain-containing protein [bacterium]|nr:GHKL domain-containing protein [bacterium]